MNPRLQALLPVAVALGFLAWPWLGLPMRFMANDDLGILAFLSRGLDPVFFGLLPGRLIRLGHACLGPDAPVYAFFLSLCAAGCAGLGTRVCLREIPPRHGWAACALLGATYLLLMVGLCIWPTFTNLGATLAAHGVLWVLTGRSYRSAVGGGALVLLGYLVRSHAALFSAALMAVPVLVHLGRGWRVLPRCLAAAATAALLLGAETALRRHATTPDYQKFLAFLPNISSAMYGEVLETGARNPGLIRELGWTPADFQLFRNWFYHDEAKFNAATIGRLVAAGMPPGKDRPATVRPVPGWDECLSTHGHYLLVALALLAAGLLHGSTRGLAVFALHTLVYAVLWYYLVTRLRLPIRVRESAINAALIGGLFLWIRLPPPAPARILRGLRGTACLLLAGWLAWKHATLALVVRWDGREQLAELRAVERAHAGKILVLWHDASYPMENLHPFRTPRWKFDAVLFGWATFSELFYVELQRLFGLKRGSDLWPALARDPRVLFVARREGMDLIRSTLAESYGLPVKPVLVGEVGTRQFWKLSPENPAASPGSP